MIIVLQALSPTFDQQGPEGLRASAGRVEPKVILGWPPDGLASPDRPPYIASLHDARTTKGMVCMPAVLVLDL